MILITKFSINYYLDKSGNLFNAKSGRQIKSHISRDGYPQYTLYSKDRRRVAFFTHRIMAEYYLPKVDGLNDVNHINGIKTDNRIENLEWISRSGNVRHFYNLITSLKKQVAALKDEIKNLETKRSEILLNDKIKSPCL